VVPREPPLLCSAARNRKAAGKTPMAFLVVYHKTNGGVIIIILNQDMTPYSVNLRKTEVPIRLYETPYMADWGGVPSCSTPPPQSVVTG